METLTGKGTLFEGDAKIADVTYIINIRNPSPTARSQLPTINRFTLHRRAAESVLEAVR